MVYAVEVKYPGICGWLPGLDGGCGGVILVVGFVGEMEGVWVHDG